MKHDPFIRKVDDSSTAVLLIHGILGTPRHFDFLLDSIPADWSVYNILLDGHGKSVSDFSGTSMAKWEQQTAAIVSELSAVYENLFVIGHSMGTLFAIDAALAHPECVRGIFLLSPPLRVHPRLRVFRDALKVGLGLVREKDTTAVVTRNAYSMEPDRHLWRYLGWIPRYLELFDKIRRTRRSLRRLQTPMQAFFCGDDELVSAKSAKELRGCSYAVTAELPASSHFAYTDEEAVLLCRAFIDFYTLHTPHI